MISQYGDIVSNSVVAILKHDPRRAIFITEKLVGQQLKILEFAAAVTRGKNELKLTDASITPVTYFIEIISLENKIRPGSSVSLLVFDPKIEQYFSR
ncbi:unnamed protein product, partial [Rotaria magnacalcarata]